eukprot:745963-Hanusia_phi.AAC.2
MAKKLSREARRQQAARRIQLLSLRCSFLLSRATARQAVAAGRLQRAYRQHLARRGMADVTTRSNERKKVRVLAEQHAACRLALAWRCRRSRALVRGLVLAQGQQKAALTLSSQWRAYKARRSVEEEKEKQRLERSSRQARRLQGAWRSHLERRRLAEAQELRRRAERAAEALQASVRAALARLRFAQRRDGTEAAARIQEAFRRHARRRAATKRRAGMAMVWRMRMQQHRQWLVAIHLDDLVHHLADSLRVPHESICLHCLLNLAQSQNEAQ